MINTRKPILLLAQFFIVTACIADGSLTIKQHENQPKANQQFDLTLPSTETASYKKRMRKPKQKKEKKAATYKDMDYDQLVAAKDILVTRGNTTSAIKYCEQLMKLCTDSTKIAEHLLELSDLFYQDAQFQKASQLYTNFSSFYPGSEKQEYALYRAIVSSFACTLSYERDQTKTEETVGLTEVFLLQDHFVTHRDEVKQIQLQCYEKLASSECYVCSYYIDRNKFTAAEKRIKRLRSKWLPNLPALETNIVALETDMILRKENLQAAQDSSFAKASADKKKLLVANNNAENTDKKTKRMAERF